MTSYYEFCQLANSSLTAVYGSEEGIDAENIFWNKMRETLPKEWIDYLDDYGFKATDSERFSECLSILRLHFHLIKSMNPTPDQLAKMSDREIGVMLHSLDQAELRGEEEGSDYRNELEEWVKANRPNILTVCWY